MPDELPAEVEAENKGNIFLSKNGSSIGVPQRNIIYVGKHGNDGDDGLTPNTAVLTFTHALTLASVQTPSPTNKFTVICLDAGLYSETFQMVEWVDIEASSATVEGQIILVDNTKLKLSKIQSTTNALSKLTGSAITFVDVDIIELNGTALKFGLSNNALNGIIIARVKQILCNGPLSIAVLYINGLGTSNGYISFQIGDIHLNSDTCFGLGAITNARLFGSVNQISNVGSPLNTFGIYSANNSDINVLCHKIEANTAILIAAGSRGSVFTNNLTGTVTEQGTLQLVEAKNSHTPVFKELSADPPDPLEGQSIMWQSDGTDSGDAGDIMIKITEGGTTKIGTLIDFSTL